ncbi:hypothetical protein J4408_02560 [Candidatus Pacearchaeota archaeon]|nr:hypothetical protein [Candidatus Pacearchaeota archaeon]
MKGIVTLLCTKKMKFPKETRRFCPYCKKHTTQKIEIAKQKSRSATHPLSRGSASRDKMRGLTSGFGNMGRRSRKGPKDWKMKTKVTKRITIMYKCAVCNKKKSIKKAIRSGRIEIGDKVAK